MSAPHDIVVFVHPGGEMYGSDKVFMHTIQAASKLVKPVVVLSRSGPLVEELKPYCEKLLIRDLGVLRRRNLSVAGILSTAFSIIGATLWLSLLIKRTRAVGVYSNTTAIVCGAAAARLRRPRFF